MRPPYKIIAAWLVLRKTKFFIWYSIVDAAHAGCPFHGRANTKRWSPDGPQGNDACLMMISLLYGLYLCICRDILLVCLFLDSPTLRG